MDSALRTLIEFAKVAGKDNPDVAFAALNLESQLLAKEKAQLIEATGEYQEERP